MIRPHTVAKINPARILFQMPPSCHSSKAWPIMSFCPNKNWGAKESKLIPHVKNREGRVGKSRSTNCRGVRIVRSATHGHGRSGEIRDRQGNALCNNRHSIQGLRSELLVAFKYDPGLHDAPCNTLGEQLPCVNLVNGDSSCRFRGFFVT